MGLFRTNYDKPGPGVEKDEVPKPGYIRFWQLYFRNFNRLLGMSLIYATVMTVLLCALFYIVTCVINPNITATYFEALEKATEGVVLAEGQTIVYNSWFIFLYSLIFEVPVWISIPLTVICIILYGPLTCGLTYCIRNFAREEHVWFSDFFTRAWRNKKQGLIFGLADQVLVLSICIYLFGGDAIGLPAGVFAYMRIVAIAIFIGYIVMRWYIYPMIVTFDLRIRGLLKNSWMFVLLGLKQNIIVAVVSLVFIAFFIFVPIFYPAMLPTFIALMFMFFWTLMQFLAQFTTYPVLYKYMIGPALADRKKAERAARNEPEPEEND